MTRSRGPMCVSDLGDGWLDQGTKARTQGKASTATGTATLTQEEADLLLDLGQMVLDLVGLVEPTPFADGTNALISLGRRDWFGAAISAVSIVPYLGDLAKAGKLGRWARTIERSVDLARRNARFAERARPLLKQLFDALGRLPVAALPEAIRPLLARIRKQLGDAIGVLPRVGHRVLLKQVQADWLQAIAKLKLPKQPSGKGVLWSKLDSYQHAQMLARADGKVTLEMVLEPLKFSEAYKLELKELQELVGPGVDLWAEFGRPVWEAVSRRYTQTLNGRVTAYVRFESTALTKEERLLDKNRVLDMVDKVTDADGPPIIYDELLTIAEAMAENANISSVELVDVFTSKTRIMERASVLRASRFSH